MQAEQKDINRRLDARLERSLDVSLLDRHGKTVNISASGVYLEVITDDADSFAPGNNLPVKITAATTTPGLKGRGIVLEGEAVVIRSDIKDVTSHGSKLGIALEFREKLKIVPD